MTQNATPEQGNQAAPAVSGGRDLARDAADIVEMCAREGKAARAAEFIRSGKSADEVGRILLADRASPAPADLTPPVELSPKEQRNYSVLAALRGALAIAEGRGSEFSGLERDVHDELDRNAPKEYKRMGGVFVPMFTGKRAALDSATSGAASQLVFTEQREFIDLLRNLMVTTRLGATFLPGLVGPVGFPRQNGAASASWVAENPVSDVAESNLTVDLVTLSPKTIQATTAYTRQLLAQTSINVENLVRTDLATVHALKWDQTAIHGAGTATEPAGLYSIAGVNSHAVGGVPSLADIVDMMTEVAKDNAFFGNLGWVTTPGMAGKLMQTLVAASAGSDMLWTGTYEDGRLGGYRASASNQISAVLGAGTNEHGILFGNWSDLMIGTWGGFEVIVDPYSQKKRGVIEVTTFQMADIDVRHPESFVKGTGATIA
jgi:HK97 family phage major capsid protein